MSRLCPVSSNLVQVAELKALGQEIPLSTFQRLRRSYEQEGLWGLVDGRATRQPSPDGLVDRRIADAVRRAAAEQATGTVGRVGHDAGCSFTARLHSHGGRQLSVWIDTSCFVSLD
jgi:hypothetical protein